MPCPCPAHALPLLCLSLLPEPIVWIDELEMHKLGMARANEEQPVDGPEYMVEASVRSRGAKRYLYYQIDIAVPWRGIMYESRYGMSVRSSSRLMPYLASRSSRFPIATGR